MPSFLKSSGTELKKARPAKKQIPNAKAKKLMRENFARRYERCKHLGRLKNYGSRNIQSENHRECSLLDKNTLKSK